MSRAQSLIKKVDSLLKKFAPPERTVYKRVIALAGDEITGHTTPTFTDTVLKPQPYFHRSGRQHLPGGHTKAEDLLDSSGTVHLSDDWQFLVSVNALSLADIQNAAVQLVAKDANGNTEVFRILDPDAVSISDTDIMYTLYVRSVKRP